MHHTPGKFLDVHLQMHISDFHGGSMNFPTLLAAGSCGFEL
jgi:hypothetical protein